MLENRISARTLFTRSFNLHRWMYWMFCRCCCSSCCGSCFWFVWLLLVVDGTANIVIILDEITGLGQYLFLFPAGECSGALLQHVAAARHLVLLVYKAIVERFLGVDDGAMGRCKAEQMEATLLLVLAAHINRWNSIVFNLPEALTWPSDSDSKAKNGSNIFILHFSLFPLYGWLSSLLFSSISFGWVAVFAARPFVRLQASLLTAIVAASNWQCACALYLGELYTVRKECERNQPGNFRSLAWVELRLGELLRSIIVGRLVGIWLIEAGRVTSMTRARAHTKVQRTTTGLSWGTSISRSLSINHFANVESMFVLIKILLGFSQILFVFVCAVLLLRAN